MRSPHLISSAAGEALESSPTQVSEPGITVSTPITATRTPRSPSGGRSAFRGVSFHVGDNRWGAYVNHDGRQTYLGGFATEAQAALAVDLAAVRLRGLEAASPTLNFDLCAVEGFGDELAALSAISAPEVIKSLRRQSAAFAPDNAAGGSAVEAVAGAGGAVAREYHGVRRIPGDNGAWQAYLTRREVRRPERLGLTAGAGGSARRPRAKKHVRIGGEFQTASQAAAARDAELVAQLGSDARTNFGLHRYAAQLAEHAAWAAAQRQAEVRVCPEACVAMTTASPSADHQHASPPPPPSTMTPLTLLARPVAASPQGGVAGSAVGSATGHCPGLAVDVALLQAPEMVPASAHATPSAAPLPVAAAAASEPPSPAPSPDLWAELASLPQPQCDSHVLAPLGQQLPDGARCVYQGDDTDRAMLSVFGDMLEA